MVIQSTIGLWAGGLLCFMWAFTAPHYRDAEGWLTGAFCLPVAVGVALLSVGWGLGRPWQQFAYWLALALVGQAVALQMIDAGPLIHYQHYKPFGRLLTAHPLLLTYLAVQIVLVVRSGRRYWPNIRAWLGRTCHVWQLLGIGLVFVLSSAPVSREIPAYVAELPLAALVQAVNLANVVLMLWSLPQEVLTAYQRRWPQWLRSTATTEAGQPGGLDRFTLLAAVWVTVCAAGLSVWVYERHPHVQDEVVYLYHARFLASGKLTMPAPPVPDAFHLYLMQFEPHRWYPSMPPGWPLVLALGVYAGIPWLVNPILGGLNVLLVSLVLRELYDRCTTHLVLLLLCVSPWYLFMAMNFMNHTLTLTCALVATVALCWARRTGQALWTVPGGCALGLMGLIRPLEGAILAGLLGLWALGLGGRRLRFSALATLVVSTAVVSAAVLPYNKLLTGNPLIFPVNAYFDQLFGPGSNDLGFGPNRGFGWLLDPFPGHGPLDALVNANLNIFSLNIELFGWSIGSLLVSAWLVLAGQLRRHDYLMLAVIVAVFGAHIFYWFSGGPDFGARYWYLMLIPCIVLTVRGIQWLESAIASATHQEGRVLMAVLTLCCLTLVNYFPWRAINKYHHYLGMRPDIHELASTHGFGTSLVLVRGLEHPDYASAAVYNPVDLRADGAVYAWDRDAAVRAQVIKAYADRPIWIVEGPTVHHQGFRVIQGPLSAHELLVAGEGG